MSLLYGVNVKSIQNEVSKNVESEEVQKLRDEVEQLKRTIEHAKTLKSTTVNTKSFAKN